MDNSPQIVDDTNPAGVDDVQVAKGRPSYRGQMLLRAAGIKFTVHGNGIHLIAHTARGRVHYWPTTKRWMLDGTRVSHRGADGFLEACDVPAGLRAELLGEDAAGIAARVPATAPPVPSRVNVGFGIRTHTTLKICPAPCGIPPWEVCLDCPNEVALRSA